MEVPTFGSITQADFPYSLTSQLSLPWSSTAETSSSTPVQEVPRRSENAKGATGKVSSKVAPGRWADLFKRDGAPTTSKHAVPIGLRHPEKNSTFNSLANICSLPPNYNAKNFIIPRGLTNLGNQCFMNVILQALLFCRPLHNLFNAIRQQTVSHIGRLGSRKELPLVEAMVMFLSEFQLLRDEDDETEALDMDPFVPDYVYEALRRHKGFDQNSRGRQEDAEEYLGYLLDGLHEELLHAMGSGGSNWKDDDPDWSEVGKGNRVMNTRRIGGSESPITQIFRGELRSTLQCPGQKASSSVEPFLTLPVDVTPDHVRDFSSALAQITNQENIEYSKGGLQVTAVRTVVFERLPRVLILHMKRFVYTAGETRKVRKHIPLDHRFSIPKSALSSSAKIQLHSLDVVSADKNVESAGYRAQAVVYHHGKHAAGGHYTVDVRQGKSGHWVHIDDTVITPIGEEEVVGKRQSEREGDPYLIFYHLITEDRQS